ncbi:THAP7 protein, partial [Haliaeetus albicilla]|nr:THAP7 protein [Haliaeetus albicilla]
MCPPHHPRLPKKDNPRRALWLENSRRRDASGEGRWDPASKYIYFCSQHFEKSCFEIVGFRLFKDFSPPPPVLFQGSRMFPMTFGVPQGHPPKILGGHPPKILAGCPGIWGQDPTPSPPDPPFTADVSCFPREGEDPAAPPAGDHGGVPALPGPSGARGPLPDGLLVATGDEEATATPALPEGDPPAPPRPVSPSLYMLRLPPPAGAYIQSEHSYQVGSALLWKR